MKKGTSKFSLRHSSAVLGIAFVACLALALLTLIKVAVDTANDRRNLEIVSDLRALSYRVTGLSRDATNGNEEAFPNLEGVLEQMDSRWTELQETGSELPGDVMTAFGSTLNAVVEQAKTITASKETILFLHQVVSTLNERLPQLQEEHTQIVEILLDGRAPADQVAVAQAQSWRAERIGRNIDKMVAGGADAEAAADQFNRDANLFGRVLEGMKNGDSALSIGRVTDVNARASLESITTQFEFVSSSVQDIFNATPALFRSRQAADQILRQSPDLLGAGAALTDAINALPDSRTFSNGLALAFGILALAALAVIGVNNYQVTRRNLQETAYANDKNQQAILRLLDEIEGLGDGDLTAEATVTQDFTGAIADAINYAILQLRELVARIQDTAESVSAAASQTRGTALQLADSSEHQAQEIIGVSAAINDMAISIDQVSAAAAESAAVAQKSVSIAANGDTVVQSNIRGMDTIREQIQDTAKRIKRLGESSQEIGDIVSLISDIADQTNILALNAAIQAAMAGDAGRGFAVVADEVQRLAERSASAAKQVAGLVKTIQTDTNEAVSSMEQTTSEVVKGAQLAHDAGRALGEIQDVSTTLAELIEGISAAARSQATTAAQISTTMNIIQDITSQTTLGTRNTAESVGELAESAIELREFVAGFKLPSGYTTSSKESVRDRDEEVPAAAVLAATAAAVDGFPSEDDHDDEPLAPLETSGLANDSAGDGEATEAAFSAAPPVFESSDDPSEPLPVPPAGAMRELEVELAGVELDEFSIDDADTGRAN